MTLSLVEVTIKILNRSNVEKDEIGVENFDSAAKKSNATTTH